MLCRSKWMSGNAETATCRSGSRPHPFPRASSSQPLRTRSQRQSGNQTAMSRCLRNRVRLHSSRISRYKLRRDLADSSSWTPVVILPRLDEPDLEPNWIDDALHDEVHELTDFPRPLVESRRRREHDRARFGGERHVTAVHERQGVSRGTKHQRARFEGDVGRPARSASDWCRCGSPPSSPSSRDTPHPRCFHRS